MTKKRQLQRMNSLEKEISRMKQEINSLKKALTTRKSIRNNSSLLQSIDPVKINEWLTILSNPAVTDLIKQFTSATTPSEQASTSKKR